MLASVQFLRFVAALAVTVYHAGATMVQIGGRFPQWFLDLAWIGSAGVPVFFAISGLVMYFTSARDFARPGAPLTFAARRLLRIYPVYWFVALLFLAFPPAYLAGWRGDVRDMFLAFLLVPGYASGIIPPGWTLAYELYFYAVFALVLVLPAAPAVVTLATVFLASVAAGAIAGESLRGVSPLLDLATNVQLLVFLAGVLIARAVLRGEGVGARALARVPPLVPLAMAVLGFAIAPVLHHGGHPATLTLGLPSIALVAWAALAEAQGRVPRAVRAWSWLGDSSYALYLVHILVMWHAAAWLGPHGDSLPAGLLAVALLVLLSLAAGLAIHHVFERPLMAWLRRRRRPQPVAAGPR